VPGRAISSSQSSLNNLGDSLSKLGHREDALAAAQEAVDIYRSLGASRPDAFLPDLAGLLGNLGNLLSAFDRMGDVLVVRREAVASLCAVLPTLADKTCGMDAKHDEPVSGIL
jgi:hypothetical protein